MLPILSHYRFEWERIIAKHVRPVARDLRFIDLDHLVRHLSGARMGNVESLVEDSCELYFRSGTLRFSQLADFQISWDTPPTITVVMTFVAEDVTAAFLLHIAANEAAVELQYSSFPPALAPHQQSRLLERSLRRAKRPKMHNALRHRSLKPATRAASPSARPTQVSANIVD